MELQGKSPSNLAPYVLLFILSPHKHPQRNYQTQDPREANVSSAVHTSIPLADSLVSFLICQTEKMGSQDDAVR